MGITDIIQTGFLVWDRIAAFAEKKQNAEELLAAYQFELRSNLDILDSVKMDALKETEITNPAFQGLVQSLHTEVAASILFSPNGANRRTFIDLLKKYINDSDRFEAENETVDGTIDSILDALSFTVRKIETLKSLARFADPKSQLFPDFRLAVRIQNINKNLLILQGIVKRIQKA
jgi:hypothetical protein